MKITLDTNFLISSTQWDTSVAHKLLKKLIKIEATLFVTPGILEEFIEVLGRDFRYNPPEVEKIMRSVLSFVEVIEPLKKVQIIKDDPDDDQVIECAIASCSELIITYDNHLLKLGRYETITILKPEEAAKIIPE